MELVSSHPFGAGGQVVRHHRLGNGLQIITLVDAASPILAYQTWFRVGSRHEREGITGIAHLFEHLMFNQTESLAPGEFDRLLERVGGDTNAATWVDWTYYRNNVPTSELGLTVRLEADRMAHLVLGNEQVESEREVVANERRFRVEDDVDGFLSEELFKLAFTTHPYHWPTIGWMRDILGIRIDDCRAFYRTYYAPNNATLVLAGDLDEDAALREIEARYGAIPAQPIPADTAMAEPEQTEERRVRFKKPVATDKLRLGYKSPPLDHPDHPVLEVIAEILFGGRSARLERLLVAERELCASTSAGLTPFRDPGLCEISVSMQRGHRAEEAEALIDAELTRIAREPVPAVELDTAKARLETRLYRELRTLSGRAEALGHYHTTLGDYRRLFHVAGALRAVTADDVARVTRAYLVPARRTVVIAEPDGAAPPAEGGDDGEEG